jgi:hypothetical protein
MCSFYAIRAKQTIDILGKTLVKYLVYCAPKLTNIINFTLLCKVEKILISIFSV